MEIIIMMIIGGLIGVVINYLNILESTELLFFSLVSFFSFIVLLSEESSWALAILAIFLILLFLYFSNRRKEQVILMTIRLMISKENYKTISVSDIVQKLNYSNKEMVAKTLKVYKSKGLIPYNIDVEYDTDEEVEKEVEKEGNGNEKN